MRNFLTILLICGVIWPSISGHKILFFKSCPTVTPMTNFDVDRFLGKWYIIEVFTATRYVNKCMTMTFERLSDTDFQVVQAREFALLDKVNVDYQHKYTGTLKMTDTSRPSEMKIKWPSHIIGSATFRVVDTDYDKYALINDCQNLFVISRLSFAILSRERTLDQETISMLKGKISDAGIDTSPLNVVDQFSCEGGVSESGTGTGTGTRTVTGGTDTGAGDGEEFPIGGVNFTEPIEANLLALIDDKEISKIKDTYQLAEHLNWQVTKEDLHDENLPHPKAEEEKKNKKQ